MDGDKSYHLDCNQWKGTYSDDHFDPERRQRKVRARPRFRQSTNRNFQKRNQEMESIRKRTPRDFT